MRPMAVLNDTAIYVYKVPPRMMSTLGHFLDNFPEVPTHKRRAVDGSASIQEKCHD